MVAYADVSLDDESIFEEEEMEEEEGAISVAEELVAVGFKVTAAEEEVVTAVEEYHTVLVDKAEYHAVDVQFEAERVATPPP